MQFLASRPEVALILALGLGHLLGLVRIGPVRLGGIAGTLIVALIIGQTSVRLSHDSETVAVAFVVFVFAPGLTACRQFIANISREMAGRSRTVVRVVAALCSAAALAGCQEEQLPPPPIRPVKTVAASFAESNTLGSLVGVVAPRVESDLGFRVGGKVIAREVDVGAVVTEGTVLARLDDAEVRNRLREAEANVAAANAQLANAQQTQARQSQLLAKGFTTQAAFDAAQAQTDVAKANVASANAVLGNARDALRYTTLEADAPGVVTATGAEPGQVVATGQMVVRLARGDQKDAVFHVPELALQASAARLPVTVALLSDPTLKTEGAVREIAPAADPVTRTFATKVTLTDPPADFRFGAAVTGTVHLPRPPVASLPASAIFNRGIEPAVWVVDPASQTVKLVPVRIARYEADRAFVASGIKDGDRVVVAGIQELRPDMKVRLLAGDAP